MVGSLSDEITEDLSGYAALEVQKRRLARQDLLAFTSYTKPNFQASRHHRIIANALMAVERGEIDRLIIEAPPRHTKSELASRRFPAWYMGRNPTKQLICASYNADLATDFGRDVRNIVSGEEFALLFGDKAEGAPEGGVTLAGDKAAAGRWDTNHGGIYFSAGIGGGTTGRGSHCLIIDDPFKDQADADSPAHREKVWKWFNSVAYTRPMPGGAIVLVNTRWHENDLAGRLLEASKEGGDKWVRVSLPAIANEDTDHEEALWPEWFPLPDLHRKKVQLTAGGSRQWACLYQQNPTPEQGLYYRREWWQLVTRESLPKALRKYLVTDYAVTDGGGDFSEIYVVGLDPDENMWILDCWFGQTDPLVWTEATIDMIEEHDPQVAYGEKGVIRRAVEPYLLKRMRERRVFCRWDWLHVPMDKPTRARPFQARAAQGKLFVVDEPWAARLINEQAMKFPAGKLRDGLDALSLMGLALNQTRGAIVREEQKEPVDSYKRLGGMGKRVAQQGSTWRAR